MVDLSQWQINFLFHVKRVEYQNKWDEELYKLNYAGSYHDPKRANEAINDLEQKRFERENPQDDEEVIDISKERLPRIIMSTEEQTKFEDAMRAKLGAMTDFAFKRSQEEDEEFDTIETV